MIHRAFGAAPAFAPVTTPPEPFELGACYRYCEGLARARHHNYPVASRFVPEFLRPHIFAIYAFVRTADDFADEPAFEGRRARELDRWEERLWACFHGEPADHPVFVALAHTIATFDLPITPFSQLLAGFRADLETRHYSTYSDLRAYTAMAAEPVGHLFLYLFGHRDPAMLRYAEDLASALALANFWQDLGTDVARGRLYVPEEDLRHFEVTEGDLVAGTPSPQTTALIRFEVARTRALFLRARPLVDAMGDDFAVEVSLMWHGGMRILSKIERRGGRTMAQKPVLHAGDKAEVVTRALAWRGGALLRRAVRAARRGGPRR
ncbi:MAG TPA: squalene/phytoene synthase family protein [Kofleriaceae bacterium]|nr:squalene/phytoene synthase family protein [Kofleriaceae bacterium]